MVEIKEFLNPKAMMTPGIAGGITVTISLPIAVNFGLSFKWIALIVSLLLSFMVVLPFEDVKSKILKGLYIILNALIIFSVSMGAGITIDPPPKFPVLSKNNQFGPNKINSLFYSLVSMSAYAQDNVAINIYQNEDKISDKIEDSDKKEPQKEKLRQSHNYLKQVEATIKKQKQEIDKQNVEIDKQNKEIKQYRIMRENYDKRWSW